MSNFVYPVRSKVTGNWWDSFLRVTHEVEPGTVVVFTNKEDAELFVRTDRADPLTDEEIAALEAGDSIEEDEPEAGPPPPKKVVKKKTTKAKNESNAEAEA